MAFIDVALSLSELSGIKHWMKELIPCFLSYSMGLIVLMSSIIMFLSDLYISASLNPGESINVISPVVFIFTPVVTDVKLYTPVKCEA